MAVTTEQSTEYALAVAKTKQEARNASGKLRVQKVTFTQGAAAGDAGSTVHLAKLPAGNINLLGSLCKLDISAFGASRVLDVGWEAYKDLEGDAVTADADGLDNDLDVSAASEVALGSVITEAGVKNFLSQDGVAIYATVAGGTIPAGATIKGFLVYTVE